jgi:Spy/CpxP family protein refolding chaperone
MTQSTTHRTRSRLRRFLIFGGIPALAAVGLFLAPRAMAFGPFHHGRHGLHARSEGEVREHMQRRVDFVLDHLDASDAQRSQIQATLDQAAPRMFALHTEGHALREELKNVLSADVIDHEKLDKLRADLDALADRATELGMDTLISVAEALTPAQRKQVAEHFARMHDGH